MPQLCSSEASVKLTNLHVSGGQGWAKVPPFPAHRPSFYTRLSQNRPGFTSLMIKEGRGWCISFNKKKKQVAEGCGLQKVASREVYVSEAKHRWCVLGQRDTWKSWPEKELQPATLWWDDDSGNEDDFFNMKKNMLKISSRMQMCYIVKCYGHSC